MEEKKGINIALHDKTGALLMIDKKERKLVKEILTVTLKSPASREWIEKKLGKEYLEIGERLLQSMGG
ncbi:MAG: hypothetical protein ABII06_01115 [Pseudomonadota bacterium]